MMNILLGFVAICIYVMIGAFIAAIVDWYKDDELAAMSMFWPVITPILILVKLVRLAHSVGDSLMRRFYKFKFERKYKR